MSLKREPYSVFYQLNSTTSNKFQLRYKHLLINNISLDTITFFVDGRVWTVVEPNTVKELYDLFKSEDIERGSVGIEVRIGSSGVNSLVEIDNFGV